MSRISVRGIAVASATAVTTVGAVVGVASGSEPTAVAAQPVADVTPLDTIDAGQQANAQVASLTEQVQSQQAAADASAKQAAAEAARKQAAADAAKKKADAEAAAKAKAEHEKEQAASRDEQRSSLGSVSTLSAGDYSVAGIQALARQIIGDDTQYQCFSNIVSRESGWDYKAVNASSGAYGLVQALPGSKMASAGADWQTNPATQIKWGLSYMNSSYHSPCGAWQFWQANSWY
ncbi:MULTISPECIES: aggregation-promoting factor C-terminal-like domain-containing protein [Streptomycetaceae]|uniref:Transglycosylase SLT domain-containing protein n=1 Tax=Streptantibioticus cattleyicolor (strain ATCC 35852 / DSM 46488 / JCM 4925 / NBRC 14057 / NRRL 8057) TaxID=1003195 RepID=F8K2G0_STREN|nr:hypothetical protein SCATT_38810 [Streptantibioticus cattleyicolor NRRL 8057 = DSM 46488]MYS60772.1 lytic transglycosylase domain-containing protein [Streptomyces sp. SID5468]CCB76591.1 conserved exported protein of unknown function [Streptantibioticus cattleyicolor NRRL 8057 = DSM 46488]